MLSYYRFPFTSVPYPHFFPPLHFCFSSLLFWSGHFCWADFLCISLASAEKFVPWTCSWGPCAGGGLWPASSPGCCFRAAGDDWHQCPILLSFKGQGIQRKFSSYWRHCVSPKERHISLSCQTLCWGIASCIDDQAPLCFIPWTGIVCCSIAAFSRESWPRLRSLQYV